MPRCLLSLDSALASPLAASVTYAQLTFTAKEFEGNHLFFYQVPERAKYMEDVIAKLPSEFQTVAVS